MTTAILIRKDEQKSKTKVLRQGIKEKAYDMLAKGYPRKISQRSWSKRQCWLRTGRQKVTMTMNHVDRKEDAKRAFQSFEEILWKCDDKTQKDFLIIMSNLARKIHRSLEQKSTNVEKPRPTPL